jgi:hypothetical protein
MMFGIYTMRDDKGGYEDSCHTLFSFSTYPTGRFRDHGDLSRGDSDSPQLRALTCFLKNTHIEVISRGSIRGFVTRGPFRMWKDDVMTITVCYFNDIFFLSTQALQVHNRTREVRLDRNRHV